MTNLVQKSFFKIPKKLLADQNFKKLSPASRLIVIYLLSLMNSFQSMVFWQKPVKFALNIGLSKMTILRAKSELKKLGIIIKEDKKKWQINMIFFCGQFLTLKTDDNNLLSNIETKCDALYK